jgi:multidrug resistance efflux pump
MSAAIAPVRRPVKRRRLLLTGLSGIVLLLASASAAHLARSQGENPAPDPPPVENNSGRFVACVGYVDLEQGVLPMQPAVAGRLADVPVHEGDHVQAGAALLRLDDQAARADVEQAEAAVRAAEAQLAEAQRAPQLHQSQLTQQREAVEARKRDLAAAQDKASHLRGLAEIGQVNKQDLSAAEEQVAKIEAGVRAEEAKLQALNLHDPAGDIARAEADLNGRRALLAKARHALGQHTLKAPSNGQVLRLFVQSGELVSPQSQQPALTFAPDEPLIVRAEIEQEFADRVSVGQRAEITDDARQSNTVYTGHVTRVANWYATRRTAIPDRTQPLNVRTLECIVQIDSSSPSLRIGQRMRVKLTAP